MRIAITGAAGFLGQALCAVLADHEVVAIDVAGGPGITIADIRDQAALRQHFDGCDAVIHTAARVGMPSRTDDFWAVNVLGTQRAVNAAVEAGVRRFVLLSSVTVFGLDFPDGVTETYPTKPTGVPYADSKIAAELVCLQAHIDGALEVTVVRPGDIYGPRSKPWTILPVEMIRSRRVAVPTTGLHSPVYVDDVVDGLIRAATLSQAAGRTFTLSGGIAVPTSDYFDHYARMLGRKRVPRLPRSVILAGAGAQAGIARRLGRTIELSPAAVRYLADRRGTYSIAAAREVLAWQPSVSLETGMARTESWLREVGML